MTRRSLLLVALCATALSAPAAAQQRPDPNAVQNLLNQFPHLTGAAPQQPAAPAPTLEQALGQAAAQAVFGAPQQPQLQQPASPAAGTVSQLLGQQIPPQPQFQQPASPAAGTVSQLLGQQTVVAPGGLAPLEYLLNQQAQQQLAPPSQIFGEGAANQAVGAVFGGQPQQIQVQTQGGQQLLPPQQLFGPQAQPQIPQQLPPQVQGGYAPPSLPPQIPPHSQIQQQPALPTSSAYLGVPAPAAAPVPAAAPSREYVGFPRYARVSGVSAGDTLKVRAEPRAQAQQLGELQPEANTLEVLETNADGSWSRILWQGGNGWVSSRYLSTVEPARIRGARTPIGLQCSGTEPFWGLRIEDERTLTYSSPENPAGTRLGLSSVSPSPNGDATLFSALPAGPERFTAIIAPAQCSDGMSDGLQGWRIDLIRALEGPGAPPPSLFGGCCRLPS